VEPAQAGSLQLSSLQVLYSNTLSEYSSIVLLAMERVEISGLISYHVSMPSCANCGAPYQAPVYRTTLCAECGKELKTCRNCRHFSPGEANDCHETVSEPVMDKDRANFCDWFSPASDAGSQRSRNDNSGAARQAFADLFGDD
jgi:hypothetical protein